MMRLLGTCPSEMRRQKCGSRLPLMSRPIVNLGDHRIYAPAFCEDSFRHVVMECFTGWFETEYFSSRQVKTYIGASNARKNFGGQTGDCHLGKRGGQFTTLSKVPGPS